MFFLDGVKSLDIIDYWNLRAIGWNVLPFPMQAVDSKSLRDLVLKLVEENFFPDRFNPTFYHNTTLLRSRSISEKQLEEFGKSLKIPPHESGEHKVVYQNWGQNRGTFIRNVLSKRLG